MERELSPPEELHCIECDEPIQRGCVCRECRREYEAWKEEDR